MPWATAPSRFLGHTQIQRDDAPANTKLPREAESKVVDATTGVGLSFCSFSNANSRQRLRGFPWEVVSGAAWSIGSQFYVIGLSGGSSSEKDRGSTSGNESKPRNVEEKTAVPNGGISRVHERE